MKFKLCIHFKNDDEIEVEYDGDMRGALTELGDATALDPDFDIEDVQFMQIEPQL